VRACTAETNTVLISVHRDVALYVPSRTTTLTFCHTLPLPPDGVVQKAA
jgi:hypothetical protein